MSVPSRGTKNFANILLLLMKSLNAYSHWAISDHFERTANGYPFKVDESSESYLIEMESKGDTMVEHEKEDRTTVEEDNNKVGSTTSRITDWNLEVRKTRQLK